MLSEGTYPLSLQDDPFQVECIDNLQQFSLISSAGLQSRHVIITFASQSDPSASLPSVGITIFGCALVNLTGFSLVGTQGQIPPLHRGLSISDSGRVDLTDIYFSRLSGQLDPLNGDAGFGGAANISQVQSLSVRNCTFANNDAYKGAAISAVHVPQIEISDALFINNTCGYDGGALYLTGLIVGSSKRTSTIRPSSVSRNSSSLSNISSSFLNHSSSSSSSSSSIKAPKYQIQGTVLISSCTFLSNQAIFVSNASTAPVAEPSAGAMLVDNMQSVRISHSQFVANAVRIPNLQCLSPEFQYGIAQGGALRLVSVESCVVADSLFLQNAIFALGSSAFGGAISYYWQSSPSISDRAAGVLSLSNTRFLNNSAAGQEPRNGTAGQGGAIFYEFVADSLSPRTAAPRLNVSACAFIHNLATFAVFNAAPGAYAQGGAIHASASGFGAASISDSQFSMNAASGDLVPDASEMEYWGGMMAQGGAISLRVVEDVSLSNVTLFQNTAVGGLSRQPFQSGPELSTGNARGGAVFIDQCANVRLFRVNATACTAESGTTINAPAALGSGGAVDIYAATDSISCAVLECTFEKNLVRSGRSQRGDVPDFSLGYPPAPAFGGALSISANHGGRFVVRDSAFSGNRAVAPFEDIAIPQQAVNPTAGGGAIYLASSGLQSPTIASALTISGTRFEGNWVESLSPSSTASGGAVFAVSLVGQAEFFVANSTFSRCRSVGTLTSAAAFFAEGSMFGNASLRMDRVDVLECSSVGVGVGTTMLRSIRQVEITRSRFARNALHNQRVAAAGLTQQGQLYAGAALWMRPVGALRLEDTVFEENAMRSDDGADGGIVYVSTTGTAALSGVLFRRNALVLTDPVAATNGGVVCLTHPLAFTPPFSVVPVAVENVTVRMRDCQFLNNSASASSLRSAQVPSLNGGAAAIVASVPCDVEIARCRFEHNAAASDLGQMIPLVTNVTAGALSITGYASLRLSLNASVFLDNIASAQSFHGAAFGGALSVKSGPFSRLTLDASVFHANRAASAIFKSTSEGAKAAGGAIFLEAIAPTTVVIQGCELADNQAIGGSSNSQGGDALGGGCFVSGSTFAALQQPPVSSSSTHYFPFPPNNTTHDDSPEIALTILESLFHANLALGGSGTQLGGIAQGGHLHSAAVASLDIVRSTFSHGTAQGGDAALLGGSASGGAVWFGRIPEDRFGSFHLASSELKENAAVGGRAISLVNAIGGAASGGAIYTTAQDTQLSSIHLHRNSVSSGSAHFHSEALGGALYFSPQLFSSHTPHFSASDLHCLNNTAEGCPASGGGLYLRHPLPLNIASPQVQVSASFFSGNRVQCQTPQSSTLVQGGAVALEKITSMLVEDSQFLDNLANIHHNKSQSLSNGQAIGGAISASPEMQSFDAIRCFFRHNQATFQSPLAFLPSLSHLRSSGLSGYAAGGAAFFQSQVPSDLSESLPTDPTDMRIAFSGCTFQSNQVASTTLAFGGAVASFRPSCDLSLSNCSFDNSTASSNMRASYGGAIFSQTGLAGIVDSSLGHSASSYGGALAFERLACNVSLASTLFSSSVASYGGGIAWLDSGIDSASSAMALLSSELAESTLLDAPNEAQFGTLIASTAVGSRLGSAPPDLPLSLWPGQSSDLLVSLFDGFDNVITATPLWMYVDQTLNPLLFTPSSPFIAQNNPLGFAVKAARFFSAPGSFVSFFWSFGFEPALAALIAGTRNHSNITITTCPPGYVLSPNPPEICISCTATQFTLSPDQECTFCTVDRRTACLLPVIDENPRNMTILAGFWPVPAFVAPASLAPCPCPGACRAINCTLQPSVEIRGDAMMMGRVGGSTMVSYLVECSQDALCKEGYTSRLCSQCDVDYFPIGPCCQACPAPYVTGVFVLVFFVGLGIVVILLALHHSIFGFAIEILLAVIGYLISLTPAWLVALLLALFIIAIINRRFAQRNKVNHYSAVNHSDNIMHPNNAHEPSALSHGLLKVVVFFLQASGYLQGINIVSLLLPQSHLKLTGLSCLSDHAASFFSDYLLYLLLPFFGIFIAVLVVLIGALAHRVRLAFLSNRHRVVACWRRCRRKPPLPPPHQNAFDPARFPFAWRDRVRRATNGFIFFLVVIYPDITDKLFSVIHCDAHGFIGSHPYIPCGGAIDFGRFSEPAFIFISSIFYLVLFCIGFPLACLWMLWRSRPERAPSDAVGLKVLTEAYKPSRFFWSIYSFGRIFVLLCLVSFLEQGSVALLASVAALLLLMAALQGFLAPFHTPLENYAELAVIAVLLLIHLVYQQGYLDESLSGAFPVGAAWLLVALNVLVLLSLLLALLWPAIQAFRRLAARRDMVKDLSIGGLTGVQDDDDSEDENAILIPTTPKQWGVSSSSEDD